ncbi:conserved Plasmodium protein, unknown function [Plasmodium ovale wallikeri]|uniref:Uncharacterized protein n=2 Tax=Plasmodium ovale TaxID=36330 RepID=A0A1A8YGI6_PLAOA|nr:conserved Plasmodium protein, unknown function [Plasmodium ovale wallikeri]SBT31293.1 conserved Plasmodium protein, unknown function [Plasmodium ovale wallikeri]SBT75302.1 conserved Plasmodium protein, unknown function [Plasmodium ovale]
MCWKKGYEEVFSRVRVYTKFHKPVGCRSVSGSATSSRGCMEPRICRSEDSRLDNCKGNNRRRYGKSFFYDEVSDPRNAENNMNILHIIRKSNIEKFTVYDCALFLNYLIKNKKNKEFNGELKNVNRIKVSSSLYREAISKILKNILTYKPRYVFFFFNKFSDLRDFNSLEILFLHMYNNHLHYFSLYYLTEIIYNIAILNCSFKKNEAILKNFLDYLTRNTIKENKNIKMFEKKITNKVHTQLKSDSQKPIYIRSFHGRGGYTTLNHYALLDGYTSLEGYKALDRFGGHTKETTSNGKNSTQKLRNKGLIEESNEQSKFSVASLSNVMMYKLIYSLAKVNHNKDLVRELFILLVPYIRYMIQNKNYVYSKDRNDMIVKIIWAFAYLHVRDINLFVDFSLCIQMNLLELKLEYVKIVKKIYENLLIFDELLLDRLEDRINHMEKNAPEQFSYPRKKQFKKKKKKIEITDEIKFKLKRKKN